jgi:hypothetical protein
VQRLQAQPQNEPQHHITMLVISHHANDRVPLETMLIRADTLLCLIYTKWRRNLTHFSFNLQQGHKPTSKSNQIEEIWTTVDLISYTYYFIHASLLMHSEN